MISNPKNCLQWSRNFRAAESSIVAVAPLLTAPFNGAATLGLRKVALGLQLAAKALPSMEPQL